jgi:tight adherence protein B
MNPNIILFVIGGLGLLLLVVGVGSSLLGGQSIVEERLGRYIEGSTTSTTVSDEEDTATRGTSVISDYFNSLGEGSDLFEGLSKDLARADVKLRPAEFIASRFISMLLVGFGAYIITRGSIPAAVIATIIGYFIPKFYVNSAQNKRLKKFDNQLGDMLMLMVNGLRAGFSTLQSMEAVSKELPDPISGEFRRVVQEMQLGIPMEDALDHLLRRINSEDLDLVITAINVQREVGGNLAEILDTITFTIRERVRIKGEIQALTAQGRATAWVISALPIALVLLLFLLNKDYIMMFFNPETRNCGIPLISLAAIMITAGFIMTQKIVDIDI